MILRIKGFDTEISVTDSTNSILIVKDHKLFSKICLNLNDYNNNLNDLMILDDNENVIKEKDLMIVSDLLTYDINNKTIISRLYSLIQKSIENQPELNDDLTNYLNKMNASILDELNDYNMEFDCEYDIKIAQYLKLINLKILSQYDNLYDKIMNILEIISELYTDKLIIFINILNYFDTDQINNIFKYKNYKKLNILCLECNLDIETINSSIYMIDDDFYDYIIK